MPRATHGEPKGPSTATGQRSERGAAPAALGEAERPGFQAVAGATFDGCHPPSVAPSSLKSQWWNCVARQKIDPQMPIHGLRDSFGTWLYEEYGVKQAQERLGHFDPATTLRHYVRLTTAARAKAVAGLDEVTRAALEQAEVKATEDAQPARDNLVAVASRRR